jgi:transcriptional repressor NrdR
MDPLAPQAHLDSPCGVPAAPPGPPKTSAFPIDNIYMLCYLSLPDTRYRLDGAPAMKCPHCDYPDSKVADSRDVDDTVRRRRECLSCGFRFTTYERVHTGSLVIIKKDQRREPFDREKLTRGIRKACEKRPLPTGTIEKIVDAIESDLLRRGRTEIRSSAVGEAVMDILRETDHIAYIRFASVYRDFEDITSLKREVDTLIAGRPVASQLPLIPDDELAPSGKRRRTGPPAAR